MPDSVDWADLLEQVKFGGESAEDDKSLDAHFLKTSQFLALANDEVDLVIGPKGSGKSAMYSMLNSEFVEGYQQLRDTLILEATGVDMHELLDTRKHLMATADDAAWANLWWSIIVEHASRFILKELPQEAAASSLGDAMVAAGFLEADGPALKAPRRDLLGLRSLFDQPGLTAPELARQLSPQSDRGSRDRWQAVFREASEVLRAADRRLWITFDQLDELFRGYHEMESSALRGLLQCNNLVRKYPGQRITLKLFLKKGLHHKVTAKSDFVNMSHLREIEIQWQGKAVIDLAARRLLNNSAFCGFYEVKPNEVSTHQDRRRVFSHLFPESVKWDGGYKVPEKSVDWVLRRCHDATRSHNPRNMIYFLNTCRREQLTECADNDDGAELELGAPLFTEVVMKRAWRSLSTRRYEDTLVAENRHLLQDFERFRNSAGNFRGLQILGRALGIDSHDQESRLRSRVRDLMAVGFLGMKGEGSGVVYYVPLLYRPALGIRGETYGD